jgi:hypothetical protein
LVLKPMTLSLLLFSAPFLTERRVIMKSTNRRVMGHGVPARPGDGTGAVKAPHPRLARRQTIHLLSLKMLMMLLLHLSQGGLVSVRAGLL